MPKADWILDEDEVRTARSQVANPRIHGFVDDARVLALCDTIDLLRARLESAEAARRELAAASGMVATAYRKLHIVEDAAGIDYSMPVSEFDLLGKAIVGLRSVLRRVEAEAGEEKK